MVEFTAAAQQVFVVTIIFAVLTLFAVVMRLIAKFYFLKSARREEVVMTFCLIISFGLIVVVWGQASHGLGLKIATLSKEEATTLLKFFWTSIILYGIGITLAKISIVLGYLRIFTTGPTKLASQIAMFLVVAFGLQLIIATCFACIPLKAFWDLDVKGTCVPKVPLFLFQASFNIFLDLFLLAIPLPVLWGLYMPLKQKLLLIVVFMLGGFVVLVSILRLSSLVKIAKSNDISFDNPLAFMWSNLEVDVAIICAALQSVRPVMAHLFPQLFSTRSTDPTPGQHYELTNHKNGSTMPISGLFSKISTGSPLQPYRSSNGGSQDAIVSPGREEKELGAIMVTREMERHVEMKDGSRRNDTDSIV